MRKVIFYVFAAFFLLAFMGNCDTGLNTTVWQSSLSELSETVYPFASDWNYVIDPYLEYRNPGPPGTGRVTMNDNPQTGDRSQLVKVYPPAESAAGHFSVSGKAQNKCFNYTAIRVAFLGDPERKSSWHLSQGDPDKDYKWNEEIYLRHGPGRYEVIFLHLNTITADLGGTGAVQKWGGIYWTDETRIVTNTKAGAAESDWTRLPSDEVQITREIKNHAEELCFEAVTPLDKLEKINKWVANTIYYDESIYNEKDGDRPGARKKQDALSVFTSKQAVCEGYANLTAALARSVGIPVRYVVSLEMNHAWIQAYIDGSWRMVDPTWNAGNSVSVNRWFNLPDNSGIKEDHRGGIWENSRMMDTVNYISVERKIYSY